MFSKGPHNLTYIISARICVTLIKKYTDRLNKGGAL